MSTSRHKGPLSETEVLDRLEHPSLLPLKRMLTSAPFDPHSQVPLLLLAQRGVSLYFYPGEKRYAVYVTGLGRRPVSLGSEKVFLAACARIWEDACRVSREKTDESVALLVRGKALPLAPPPFPRETEAAEPHIALTTPHFSDAPETPLVCVAGNMAPLIPTAQVMSEQSVMDGIHGNNSSKTPDPISTPPVPGVPAHENPIASALPENLRADATQDGDRDQQATDRCPTAPFVPKHVEKGTAAALCGQAPPPSEAIVDGDPEFGLPAWFCLVVLFASIPNAYFACALTRQFTERLLSW